MGTEASETLEVVSEVEGVSAVLEPVTASVPPRTVRSATASRIIKTQTSMDSVPAEVLEEVLEEVLAAHHFLENKPRSKILIS